MPKFDDLLSKLPQPWALAERPLGVTDVVAANGDTVISGDMDGYDPFWHDDTQAFVVASVSSLANAAAMLVKLDEAVGGMLEFEDRKHSAREWKRRERAYRDAYNALEAALTVEPSDAAGRSE